MSADVLMMPKPTASASTQMRDGKIRRNAHGCSGSVESITKAWGLF